MNLSELRLQEKLLDETKQGPSCADVGGKRSWIY